MSPDQAAAMLGVNRSTVYDLLRSRELRSFRVGRSRRIAVAEIEAWMDRQARSDSGLRGPRGRARSA